MRPKMSRHLLLITIIGLTLMSSSAMAAVTCFSTNPAKFSRCIILGTFTGKNFYEGNIAASLFDGSLEKACLQLYGNEKSMYNNNSDPAALACALMVCGQEEYFNADPNQYPDRTKMCSWFKYMVATERDKISFTNGLQDLKNYLGLIDLEQAKNQALRKYQIMPFQNKAIYSGVKYGIYGRLANERMDLFDVDYLKMNLFANKLQESKYYYVTSRMKRQCSTIEEFSAPWVNVSPQKPGGAENIGNLFEKLLKAAPNLICKSQGNLLPYDLLASSLHAKDTILSDQEQDDAKAFIQNLLMPTTPRLRTPAKLYVSPQAAMLPKYDASKGPPAFFLTQEGEINLGYKFREAMVLTAVSEPYRKLLNFKMPVSRDQYFKQFEKKDDDKGGGGSEGEDEKKKLTLPKDITPSEYIASVDEALATETNRRLSDQKWFMAINTASKSALNREAAMIMATELVVLDKIMHHLDGISLMLAVDIAQMSAIDRNAASANTIPDMKKSLEQLVPEGFLE